jgi:hypothetical protein
MNKRDLDDAKMEANEFYDAAFKDIHKEWVAPYVDTMARMVWNSIDDTSKAYVKENMPNQYKDLERRFGNAV